MNMNGKEAFTVHNILFILKFQFILDLAVLVTVNLYNKMYNKPGTKTERNKVK